MLKLAISNEMKYVSLEELDTLTKILECNIQDIIK